MSKKDGPFAKFLDVKENPIPCVACMMENLMKKGEPISDELANLANPVTYCDRHKTQAIVDFQVLVNLSTQALQQIQNVLHVTQRLMHGLPPEEPSGPTVEAESKEDSNE